MFTRRQFQLVGIILALFSVLTVIYTTKLWKTGKNATATITILYWSTVFGNPYLKTDIHFQDCLCVLTPNKSVVEKADALVVHARDIDQIPPEKYKAKPWILHSQENPVYTPALKDKNILSKFNLALTYRLDSDVVTSMFNAKPKLDAPIAFEQKTGVVISVSSNCERVRTEYQRRLSEYIQVDSYGACLNNKNDLVKIYGKDFKLQKEKLERKYKFSLVFSNQDCEYFVDDRITHSWNAGSVPVWMGTDKIDEFLVGNMKDSIIKVKDFETPKKLAEFLVYLSKNETAYNKYLEWKWKGFGECTEKTRQVCHWWGMDGKERQSMWCELCNLIRKGKVHDGLKVDNCQPRSMSDWIKEY